MKITILGAGAYGSALGLTAQQNHHEVTFYDPSKYPEIPLSASIESAEAVILCVPSEVTESVLQDLSKIPETLNLLLICATKGLLGPAIFQKLGFTNPIILSGAGFASEFQTSEIFLTATDPLAKKLFGSEKIHFDYTNDLTGVMLCGTLKNIFAIDAGWHSLATLPKEKQNTKIDQYLRELAETIAANGGNRATANLNCGKRDLALTCLSTESRNYQLGQKIAKITDKKPITNTQIAPLITQTTEGWSAAERIVATPDFIIPNQAPTLQKIVNLAIPTS